jgi:hypothetical protein
MPAIETIGTEVVGLAKTVRAQAGELSGRVVLHGGPLGAVYEGRSVFDEAKGDALALVDPGTQREA